MERPRGEERHAGGSAGFRAACVALCAAGVSTFALLYATQPLMPVLARDFHVSAATAALTLSVATAALGLGLLPAGWLSDRWGRTPMMSGSLLASAILGIVAAIAPTLPLLLTMRALQGLALAGLPAVAMTYLSEEIDPGSLGLAMGIYVGGNAVGGMLGRLGAGVLADLGGWRLALAAVGALGLACAVVCVRILPPSRHFVARGLSRRGLAASLSDRALRRLYLMGALLMGTFVAVYNGLGFRLEAQPYGLGPGAIAAVFLVYPIGVVSAAVAGRLADWIGRRRVLPAGVLVAAAGLAVTAFRPLPVVIAGMAVLTAGFFAAHSVASSWVGRRGGTVSAQAPALYLLAYYAGSSVAGTLAGSAWSLEQWTGVLVLGGSLLAIALAVSLRLRRTPPLGAVRPAPLAA